MKNGDIVSCPSCNGKGHTLDGVATVCSIVGMFIAPFETNNKDGLTRQPCSLCKGKGFIKVMA